MCPGGWIGNANRAVELRYLSKERPVASDLAPPRRGNPNSTQRSRKKESATTRNKKRYAAVTGEICGKVVAENAKDGNAGVISFLSPEASRGLRNVS